MNSVYILWQDQDPKLWHTVAKLTRESDLYRLNYTQGVNNTKYFTPFPKMPDFDKVYESKELFPFFSNRILPKNRPEFKNLIRWLDIDTEKFDPLEYLGVTGGVRKTDNYRILKLPKLENGKYIFDFLVSGIHYLSEESQEKIKSLKAGDELDYFFEVDNPVDKNAIGLKITSSGEFVGYCPRYLVNDFKKLIELGGGDSSSFKIKKVNLDAPSSYRMVCRFESKENDNYSPLMFEEYMAHTIVHT